MFYRKDTEDTGKLETFILGHARSICGGVGAAAVHRPAWSTAFGCCEVRVGNFTATYSTNRSMITPSFRTVSAGQKRRSVMSAVSRARCSG